MGNAFEALPFGWSRLLRLRGAALRQLLCAVASDVEDTEKPHGFTNKQIADKAEELGLMDTIAGYAKDPRKVLGHKLKLLRGREFTDSRAGTFEKVSDTLFLTLGQEMSSWGLPARNGKALWTDDDRETSQRHESSNPLRRSPRPACVSAHCIHGKLRSLTDHLGKGNSRAIHILFRQVS